MSPPHTGGRGLKHLHYGGQGPERNVAPSHGGATLQEPSQLGPTTQLMGRPSLKDIPLGEPVPGKIGFVFSPDSKTELLDISGIPAGPRVKCPYTSNGFRVP